MTWNLQASDSIIIAFVASIMLCLHLAASSLRIARNPSARLFLALLLLEAGWGLGQLMELISPTINTKILWDNLQFPLALATAFTLLIFSMVYTRRRFKRPRLSILLLLIPTLSSIPLTIADGRFRLLRVSPAMESRVSFGELTYGYTWVSTALFAWSLLLAGAGIVMLFADVPKRSGFERNRLLLMICGYLIPFLGITATFLGTNIFGRRDVAAVWFAAGNLPIAYALFRYRLFDVLPLAYTVLLETLEDPVFVLDTDWCIADYNASFALLTGSLRRQLRGKSVEGLFADWPQELLEALRAPEPESERVVAGKRETNERLFRLSISSIPGTGIDEGTTVGRTVIMQDITELWRVERELRHWNSELEGKIRERTALLEGEVGRRIEAERSLQAKNASIRMNQREILMTLSEVVESRSKETAHHVMRVGEYARIFSNVIGIQSEGMTLLADAAPMHDIGKIAVPDSILNKRGPLTDEERSLMRVHTTVGHSILCKSDRSLIQAAATIALEHHEYWNGCGYPAGKSGDGISLSGRIVCVCDVFDALVTKRVYKNAWAIPRVLEFFRAESGKMFDPELVRLLFLNFDRFLNVAAQYPDASPPLAAENE